MKHLLRLAALVALAFTAVPAQAQLQGEYPGLETGKMWTFDVPPLDYWAKRYDFRPSQQWLDHVRLSAVRYGGGCSASFVSPNGLVMTNHHCARACIESATKEGEDFLADGFYAKTKEEERACQGLFLDQLQEITDVTPRVMKAIAGARPEQAGKLRTDAVAAIEKECQAEAKDKHCQVVTFYRGGQYKLYRFHRFNDVRLVMAPEAQIAFFGGDPDNFTYPRHDLDMTFVRAYDNGKPADTPHHFKWSPAGTKEGDLTFVIGNPGSTGRLNTMSQLQYLRDVAYPSQMKALDRRIGTLEKYMQADTVKGKSQRNAFFGLQNTRKAIGGYQTGLLDEELMAHKAKWEKEFIAKVNANPELKAKYGTAWAEIAKVQDSLKATAVKRRYEQFQTDGGRLLPLASLFARYQVEMAKPDADRLPAFKEANRRQTEAAMVGGQPIDTDLEIANLTTYFEAMASELPATHPARKAAMGTRTPAEAARAMVESSVLKTPAERKALFEAGGDAIAKSNDPFLALARTIDPLERRNAKAVQALMDRETAASEKVAQALLATYGNGVSPDATFSLRISDGEVKRYPLNGTYAPAYTTFSGLYDRSRAFDGAGPWALPKRWQERKAKLDDTTPYNVAATNDIIGGNSGSPVVNKDAEVVGLIFDGNMEMLPNRFLFTEKTARSVFVDSRAIIEALRKVYDADALADELQGAKTAAMK
ncbi:MAG TPA: S46 family peptidase [Gemmatimonadales bacterium]|nr:S46 family peptidase [Gemmatimonadales bacterium]